jgi:hypothetical protein
VALGSGRSCASTIAVPDVEMIETALAGGTVAREMICAGLSEHRTTVGYSAAEFTKGCVWGAAGSENLPAAWPGWHSGRKERLRANPQTMDRDPDRGCQLEQTRTTQETSNRKSAVSARAGGLCPPGPPRFIALVPIPERQNRNGTPREYYPGVPSPVLVPGAALGSRLRVALSSGQVTDHPICDPGAEPLSVRTVPETSRRKLSELPPSRPSRRMDRIRSLRGRVLSRTDASAFVIRDPGRSILAGPSAFWDPAFSATDPGENGARAIARLPTAGMGHESKIKKIRQRP